MGTNLRATLALMILMSCLVVSAAPQHDSGTHSNTTVRTKQKRPRPPKTQPPKRPGAIFSTRSALETVSISNFQFTPKKVVVKVGGTVMWDNKDGSHTVTADNDSFSSPTLTAGQSFSHKFTKTGTYRYYCSFHGGAGGSNMSGTVTVVR